MQIDTNLAANANSLAAPGATPSVAPLAVTVPVAKLDTTSFHDSLDLKKDLDQTEGARAEKVEQALNLIGQVQWPPVTVIRRIANLLAAHLQQNPEL